MRKNLAMATALLICTSQAPATAAPTEQPRSPVYNRCMDSGDAAQGVTSAMIECTQTELSFQDGKLNQAYRMIMARLPAPRQAELRQAQRAWIRSRDAICKRERRQAGDGTFSQVAWLDCLVDKTVKRTKTLERYR